MKQKGYRESYSKPSYLNHFYRYENKPAVYIEVGGKDFRLDCINNEAAEKAMLDIKHAVTLAANYQPPKGN
jgi:hypothetical protein